MEKSRGKLEMKKAESGQRQKRAKNKRDTLVELTKAALVTALFCILAPHTLYLPFSPVGITLGSFLLYLTGLLLGPKYGSVSAFLYLCLGFLGLPVFAGYTAGAGALFGPTGGFLMGYIPCVALIGVVMKTAPAGRKGLFRFMAGLLLGTVVLYGMGTLWFLFGYAEGATLSGAVSACVIPFLPFDGIKIILAAVFYKPLLRLKRYI